MKVVCSKENLLKGLNTVLRAVPVRTTLDILKCILIHAENDKLTFTANDTSLGIETKTDALILEEGTIALDAALFSSIIRKLPEAESAASCRFPVSRKQRWRKSIRLMSDTPARPT